MIRDITPDDEAALAAFFAENNRPEMTATFFAFPLDAATARRIAREPRRDRYFAVWDVGAIVGLGMLRGWDEGFAVPSFGVLVDHRAQGRGHGRALTAHALAVAREEGFTPPQFREARNERGELGYFAAEEAAKLIAGLPLVEVEP